MWSSTVVYGGRRPMGSLIEELGRREAAARAESDRLRARIEELTEELARAEEQVTRLAITREEVTRVLEEPPAADAAPREGGSGGEPGPGSPIGAMTVPPRRRRCRSRTRTWWKWPRMRGGRCGQRSSRSRPGRARRRRRWRACGRS